MGDSGSGPHCMQTAQAAAEADLRPEKDVAAWRAWEGLRAPGQHSLRPSLPSDHMLCSQKTSAESRQKDMTDLVLPLEGWGPAAKSAISNTCQAPPSK